MASFYFFYLSKMQRYVWLVLSSFLFVQSIPAQMIHWKDAISMDPKSVEYLDCSGLKWDSLPQELCLFTALKELNLSKNKLKSLPPNFAVLQQLEKLDLGRNKFENFPLVVCQLSKLKVLHLDRNQITLLPLQIADLQQLEYLDLYANGIEQFGEGLFSLPVLRTLNIEGVMYGTVFAKQLLERLPKTKVLIDPPCKCLD